MHAMFNGSLVRQQNKAIDDGLPVHRYADWNNQPGAWMWIGRFGPDWASFAAS